MRIDDGQLVKLLGALGRGRANAKTADVLQVMSGIAYERRTQANVREAINELRARAYPIGGCDAGYYLVETADELEEVVRGLNGRIAGIARTRDLIADGFRRLQAAGGNVQLELWPRVEAAS